jgi:hypothetical protein
VRPSPPLYGTVRYGQCQLRDTVPPTLVRPTRHTLERGWRNPRKGDRHLFRARPGPRRDVGQVRRVSFITICPVWPSPPSQRHPGHCSAIPDTVQARGDKTPPRPRLCPLRPPVSCTLESAYRRRPNEKLLRHHPQSHSWTDTGHAMTLRQKQDSPGQPSTPRHCTPCHHTLLEQCGTPINCLPLAYKRRGSPLAAGGRKRALTRMLSAFTTILTLCLNHTSGTWRLLLLSRLACSAPLQAPRCNTI